MDETAKTIELNIVKHLDFMLQYLELSKNIDITSIPFTYAYLYSKFTKCFNEFIENYQSPLVLTLDFDEESVNDIITDDFIGDLSPEIKNLRVFVKNYLSKFITMNIVEPIYECSICLNEGLVNDEGSCETPCCLQSFHKNCIGTY